MKILIADDDNVSLRVLEAHLEKAGHFVISCSDGDAAQKAFQQERSVEIVILDWMMPGKNGLEVCRAIKEEGGSSLTYVIMLTVKHEPEEIAQALEAGADDFVTKPFNAVELQARIKAGVRTVRLQKALIKNIVELEDALDHVEQLRGILPICAWCKKVRDDSNYWESVEEYVRKHSKAVFTHSICPECIKKNYPEEAEKIG